MLVANSEVTTEKNTFRRGETVTGLSSLDERWMLAAGYISKVPEASPELKARKTQRSSTDAPQAGETSEGR